VSPKQQWFKKVQALAKSVIARSVDPIDACRAMHNLYFDERHFYDIDLNFFVGIASLTDHLPTEEMKHLCSESMWRRSEEERETIRQQHEAGIDDECRSILALRFEDLQHHLLNSRSNVTNKGDRRTSIHRGGAQFCGFPQLLSVYVHYRGI